MAERAPLTSLLDAVAAGDAAAQGRLFELAYAELTRIARGVLRRAAMPLSVNPSTLVHEAYLKFARDSGRELNDSTHFYSLLARAMRQVVLDLGRERGAARRGGGQFRTELTDGLARDERPIEELLAIDQALTGLAAVDAELAELVEWHFFGGLAFVDIARIRGVTERTVRRHWELARTFLIDAMPGADASA